jgi:hypothetical protein
VRRRIWIAGALIAGGCAALLQAGVEPKEIDVERAGDLFAVTVMLPEEEWASARPALAYIRRLAEEKAGAPVGASFAVPRKRTR